jgi:Arc/MetJ family transcription regulator
MLVFAPVWRLTGLTEKSALLREALKALIHMEASRRLALLGGTMPGLKPSRRRRPESV